ncbi:MAG TPA: hypothetical protein EYP28_06385 [Methanophagales archaeon]|nr:hypothetical protein [Methanophagales archaeon]
MKKFAIAIAVLILMMLVNASQAAPVTSTVEASPNPTCGSSHVTLTAEVSVSSDSILSACSSSPDTNSSDTSDDAKEEVANSLNSLGIIIEDIEFPLVVKPNELFNVSVYTAYNFSNETAVYVALYDDDAWVPIPGGEFLGNLSGTGDIPFFFSLVITSPEMVNLTALAAYENESNEWVSDLVFFQIVALNFSIDNIKHPSRVKSNETFSMIIETSYDVTPGTRIDLDIYNTNADKIYKGPSKTFSGTGKQSINIPLPADPSGTMELIVAAFLVNELMKDLEVIDRKSVTINIIEKWIVAAEYFIDSVGEDGTGNPMNASDGAFDLPTERVTASVPTAGLTAGTHKLYVHGKDSKGNWGDVECVILNVTCPFKVSDIDHPTEVKQYNSFAMNVNTSYSFCSETKAKVCVYKRDTEEFLGASHELTLSGSGCEQVQIDLVARSLGVINLSARAYYLNDEQDWVFCNSSDLSINLTAPITISNVIFPNNIKRYNFFSVSVYTNYSFSSEITANVSIFNRDTEKLIGLPDEKVLSGSGSERFRIDLMARSPGAMNLSARVYYLDDRQNWVFCDSSDFYIFVP